MGKKLINQNGIALILVLLIITIIGILVPPLMSSVLSSATQYQKTEESFQRTKLEEMAKLYFEKTVKQIAKSINSNEDRPNNETDFLVELNDELNELHPVIPSQLEEKKQKFRIEYINGIDINGLKISYSIVTIINDIESENSDIVNELNEYLNIKSE
ncbi:hypothetical protein RJD24_15945 [Bacillaceae bacterium IKA-2]|nr:hypothetical protein RJD24_15945 [Bacillaceae bacterium IKA-2]